MKYVGEDIYTVIPNRYPLMFLSSLEVFDNTAIGIVNLTADTWFFKSHYPGRPIMPFTLLIEGMAQTFSSIFLSKVPMEIPVIVSIGGHNCSGIKMAESAEPGDILCLEAYLTSFKRGIARGGCRALKKESDKPIMEIEIVEALPSQMVRML